MKDKKQAFFENAELLADTWGIVPLMYGSLGLEYLTGEELRADDIDILIPQAFITERWGELRSTLEGAGYRLTDEHEHEFEKDGIRYAYARIEELESFAGIGMGEIATVCRGELRFMLLSLEQYLRVYTASSKDGYRAQVRGKKDPAKIALIQGLLQKGSGGADRPAAEAAPVKGEGKVVERAHSGDILQLTELRLAFLQEEGGGLKREDADRIRQGLPGYFERNLDRSLFCYLIRERGEVVSCAFLLVTEKPHSPTFPTGRAGTVLNVYTRPEYRRRGHAGQIMRRLLQDAEAMELSPVELKATEDGYRLYSSLGFKEETSRYRPMTWRRGQDPAAPTGERCGRDPGQDRSEG